MTGDFLRGYLLGAGAALIGGCGAQWLFLRREKKRAAR